MIFAKKNEPGFEPSSLERAQTKMNRTGSSAVTLRKIPILTSIQKAHQRGWKNDLIPSGNLKRKWFFSHPDSGTPDI